jgi:membrane-associated phospholipid phosphatase
MKNQILLRLLSPPKLRKTDILILIIPALLLWIAIAFGRPMLITTRCVNEPQSCTRESVFVLDRVSLGLEDSAADGYSAITQSLSGILAFGGPALWSTALAVSARLTPAGALAAVCTDVVLLLQGATINGLINEVVRIFVQRPRPSVYLDPANRGTKPAHYTSFYSGHTSFAAFACTMLVLALLGRGAPLTIVGLSIGVGQSLVLLTGFYRVFAGRHFITDVVVAAMMGTLIAFAVSIYHRPPAR